MKTITIVIRTDKPYDLGNLDRTAGDAQKVTIEVADDGLATPHVLAAPRAVRQPAAAPVALVRPGKARPLTGHQRLLQWQKDDPRIVLDQMEGGRDGTPYTRVNVEATLKNMGLNEERLLGTVWSKQSTEARLRSSLLSKRMHERLRKERGYNTPVTVTSGADTVDDSIVDTVLSAS